MANDSWNFPALFRKIVEDVPFLQRALTALVKFDPSTLSDVPADAKRLKEVSTGNWQIQRYNGTSWEVLKKMLMDADTVDGYQASITPNPNTVAVRNSKGLLEDSISGNAATASTADTLSEPLVIGKGGTEATTPAQARKNLGVPPVAHASGDTTYGSASGTLYGHVMLSDDTSSTSGVNSGVAATPNAVKLVKDANDTAIKEVNTELSKPASSSHLGRVKIGKGVNVTEDGTISAQEVNAATTTSKGVVQVGSGLNIDNGIISVNRMEVGSGHPLGYEFASLYIPEGCLLCNGALYDKTTYADLFALKQKEGRVVSEVNWQEIAAANGGYCAMYADNGTHFRVPKPAPYLKLVLDDAKVGQYEEAGLPNITGQFVSSGAYTAGSLSQAAGAFYLNNPRPGLLARDGTAYSFSTAAYIDASRSSDKYGKSNTVTPESTSYLWVVQAFGVATNVGAADVGDALAKFGELQATKVDIAGATNAAAPAPYEFWQTIPTLATKAIYTMPENGFLRINSQGTGGSGSVWSYLRIVDPTNDDSRCNAIASEQTGANSSMVILAPVYKGQKIAITYSKVQFVIIQFMPLRGAINV